MFLKVSTSAVYKSSIYISSMSMIILGGHGCASNLLSHVFSFFSHTTVFLSKVFFYVFEFFPLGMRLDSRKLKKHTLNKIKKFVGYFDIVTFLHNLQLLLFDISNFVMCSVVLTFL